MPTLRNRRACRVHRTVTRSLTMVKFVFETFAIWDDVMPTCRPIEMCPHRQLQAIAITNIYHVKVNGQTIDQTIIDWFSLLSLPFYITYLQLFSLVPASHLMGLLVIQPAYKVGHTSSGFKFQFPNVLIAFFLLSKTFINNNRNRSLMTNLLTEHS